MRSSTRRSRSNCRAWTEPSLLAVLLLLLCGCNAPVMHPWQLPGDGWSVTMPIGDWPVVPQSLYVAVPYEAIVDAQALLQEREWVLLSAEQESVFNQHLSRPEDLALKPYLVRAVTMGTPYYSIVRRNPATNEVAVYRATWNGEMSFPFLRPRFGIWPIVIYLANPPLRVYPTAVYGGDWIMAGVLYGDTRLLHRAPAGETAR